MGYILKKQKSFSYLDKGEGTPIIILHGLMGGLSNFEGVTEFFSKNGYRVIIPELPIYSLPILKTTVKNLALHVSKFMDFMQIEEAIILGKEQNLDASSLEEILATEEVQRVFDQLFRSYSRTAAAHEKIRGFRLVLEPFSIENGMMTPTMKLKRKVIKANYGELIDSMYANVT